MNGLLRKLQQESRDELFRGILPFWMEQMVDEQQGGFYGRMDGNNTLHTDADKGGILNARILWTFAAAYRTQPDPAYLAMATRAYEYTLRHFFDNEAGGTYWLLHADGTPRDTRKQIYSQAFFVYALSEYYRATGCNEALCKAIDLFRLIEHHSLDRHRGGYLEAYSRDWHLLDDLRLSEKDDNEKKTMNTHLHILEAYTNLYRVWKDEALKHALHNLILLFTDRIVSASGHLVLFFDENWLAKDHIHSYGHDIEAAWLLYEAASVLGDSALQAKVGALAVRIAETTVREGLQPDGSLWYETDILTGHTDTDRHWWPQAEAVVGFLYIWRLTGNDTWLQHSANAWNYIRCHLIDHQQGEWFWSIRNGAPNRHEDKAGFWKCPYHNSRMCLETIGSH